MQCAMGARRFYILGFLQIVGQYDCRDAALGQGNPDGAIDEVSDLGGGGGLLHERAGHVLE